MDIVLYITYPNMSPIKLFLFCFRSHRDISNDPYINIPSVVENTGLAPNRRHAIICNKDCPFDGFIRHLV